MPHKEEPLVKFTMRAMLCNALECFTLFTASSYAVQLKEWVAQAGQSVKALNVHGWLGL